MTKSTIKDEAGQLAQSGYVEEGEAPPAPSTLQNILDAIRKPLATLAGNIIFPISYEEQAHKYEKGQVAITPSCTQTTIAIETKTGVKSFCQLYTTNNTTQPRDLVVFFCGNGENIQEDFKPEEITKLQKQGKDVLLIQYPANVISKEAPIQIGEAAMRMAIKELKYEPKNTTIIGHSIGGAVSANVLNRCKTNGVLEKGQKFKEYFNHNSLSYVSRFISNNVVVRAISRFFTEALNFELKPADHILNTVNPLPVEQIHVTSTVQAESMEEAKKLKEQGTATDGLIKHTASLEFRYNELADSNKPTNIHFNTVAGKTGEHGFRTQEDANNGIIKELLHNHNSTNLATRFERLEASKIAHPESQVQTQKQPEQQPKLSPQAMQEADLVKPTIKKVTEGTSKGRDANLNLPPKPKSNDSLPDM